MSAMNLISFDTLRDMGERIMAELTPVLLALIGEWRTKKAVKKYADYLWVLGGELIRHVRTDEKGCKLPARAFTLKHIDGTGGPLWRHARGEQGHAVYDAVWRRFYQLSDTKSKTTVTNSAEEPIS